MISPTLVNLRTIIKMVMELKSIYKVIFTGNGKIINLMGTGMWTQMTIQSSLVSWKKAKYIGKVPTCLKEG